MTTHRRYHLFGNLLHFHRFSSETEGTHCLVEAVVAPGAGAPPHRHPGEVESFVILDGQFEFTLEGKTSTAGPGDFVAIPNGAKHSFANVGDTPGRLAIFATPGNVHDAFFTGAGDAVAEESWSFPPPADPDMAKVMAAAGASGVEIFPPDA